jgi:hypothetical protein
VWPSQNQNPPPSACWGAYPAERLIGYSAALAPYIPTRNEQSWGFKLQFRVKNAAGRGGLLTRSSSLSEPPGVPEYGKNTRKIDPKLSQDRRKIDQKSLGGGPGAFRGDQGRSGALPGGVQRGLGARPGPPEALPERPEGSRIDPKTPWGGLGTTFSSDLFAERFAGGSHSDFRVIFDQFLEGPRPVSLHRRSVS